MSFNALSSFSPPRLIFQALEVVFQGFVELTLSPENRSQSLKSACLPALVVDALKKLEASGLALEGLLQVPHTLIHPTQRRKPLALSVPDAQTLKYVNRLGEVLDGAVELADAPVHQTVSQRRASDFLFILEVAKKVDCLEFLAQRGIEGSDKEVVRTLVEKTPGDTSRTRELLSTFHRLRREASPSLDVLKVRLPGELVKDVDLLLGMCTT